MIAFDTNVAIYILNNNPQFVDGAVRVIERAQQQGCCLSVVLITEVLCFAGANNIDELETFLQSFRNTKYIDYDAAIARQAAAILRQYPAFRIADAVHLATALATGATEFWTNDTRLAKFSSTDLRVRLLSEL